MSTINKTDWITVPSTLIPIRIKIQKDDPLLLIEESVIRLISAEPLRSNIIADYLRVEEPVIDSVLRYLESLGLIVKNTEDKYSSTNSELDNENTKWISGYAHYCDIAGEILPWLEIIENNYPQQEDPMPIEVISKPCKQLNPEEIKRHLHNLLNNLADVEIINHQDGGVNIENISSLDARGQKPGTCFLGLETYWTTFDCNPLFQLHCPIPKKAFKSNLRTKSEAKYLTRFEELYPESWENIKSDFDTEKLKRKQVQDSFINPQDRERVRLESEALFNNLIQIIDIRKWGLFKEEQLRDLCLRSSAIGIREQLSDHTMKEFLGSAGDFPEAFLSSLKNESQNSFLSLKTELKIINKAERAERTVGKTNICNRFQHLSLGLSKTSIQILIDEINSYLRRPKGPGAYFTYWLWQLTDKEETIRNGMQARLLSATDAYPEIFTERIILTINIRNSFSHDQDAGDEDDKRRRIELLTNLEEDFKISTHEGRSELLKFIFNTYEVLLRERS